MRRPRRSARPVTLRRRRPGVRRLLAAGLVAGAAAAGLPVLAPTPAPRVPVLVAAHDLAAGARLSEADVVLARWAPGTEPARVAQAPAAVVGRVAAGPVPRGAPVTDAELLGPGLLVGMEPGRLAVAVRLADPAAAALARRGDRVDLLTGTGSGAVVTGVIVLAEPGPSGDDAGTFGSGSAGSAPSGALVIVAVTSGEAAELARAQANGPLSLAVHAP